MPPGNFSQTLDAKRPIPQLGRHRLRFDSHMLVAEYRPPLGWSRFAPEVALASFAALAIVSVVLLIGGGAGAELAWITGPPALVLALVTVRLEIQKRRRRAFVLNYATRTVRLDDVTRFGRTRTQIIPFFEIEEAGVTRDRRGLAFEIQIRATPWPRVEVLLSNVPESQAEELFRFADMARSAFGLVPPGPPHPEPDT